MTRAKLREILQVYREGLAAVLGDRLVSVILYGSHARGDAREDSDIDVLCIIRDPFDYGEMIARTSELTAGVALSYEVALSRVFVTRDAYERRQSPFLMNVRREGASV